MTTDVRHMTRPLVSTMTQLDTVVAILCFGSMALGTADAQSDVDILAICDPTIPTLATRRHCFQRQPSLADLQLHRVTPGWNDPWAPQTDTFIVNHTRYDVSYNTHTWLIHIVQGVHANGATSLPGIPFRLYTVLGLLSTAVILYDPQHIAHTLVQQTHPYPALLQTHILDEFVPIMGDGVQELRDYASRDIGNTAFLFQLFRVCDALCSVLFAINETYAPAAKRVEQRLAHLPKLPHDFVPRYTRVLEGPFMGAQRQQIVDGLAALTRDIHALL